KKRGGARWSQTLGCPLRGSGEGQALRRSGLLMARRIRKTIAVQIGAVGIEPSLGHLMIRNQPVHHAPEPCRMVHFDEMRHLVGGEVLKHVAWRQNEPPRKR